MVPGDAGEGGRGELDEGAGVGSPVIMTALMTACVTAVTVCSPDQLDPLHVTVEGENVVQEIWLTHVLKITGCRTSLY